MAAVPGPTPFNASNNTSPANDGFAITPSDTVNFNSMFRAIYVGVGGNIVVVTPNSAVLTFLGVPVGTILPVMGIRVNSTNTTATNLIGLV